MKTDDAFIDQAIKDIIKFCKDVIEYQTHNLRREDYDYSLFGFDIMCHSFMIGAMMSYSEKYTFTMQYRELSLLCLLDFLVKEHGWSIKEARKRISQLNEAQSKLDSIGNLTILVGYKQWQNPDGLRTVLKTERAKGWSSQTWSDSWLKSRNRMLKRLAIAASIIVILLAVWLL